MIFQAMYFFLALTSFLLERFFHLFASDGVEILISFLLVCLSLDFV